MTASPTLNLLSDSGYYIQIATTCIKDDANNFFVGITNTTDWNFETVDLTAPLIFTLSPADDAVGVALTSNLSISFDEDVIAGSGNISLFKADGTLIEDFDVTTDIVVAGSSVLINPTANLEANENYYIHIDATCFDDIVGHSFAGISNATDWDFGTSTDLYQFAEVYMTIDYLEQTFYSLTREVSAAKVIITTNNHRHGALLFINNATSNSVFIHDGDNAEEIQINTNGGTKLIYDATESTNGAWVIIN